MLWRLGLQHMNFRKDIIQPTTSYHRASLPHPFLLWSQPWDVQLASCRKDVPLAGPHGSSGPAPLCSFCTMVCGIEIHSSTHTWHLGLGLLGRWSEAPPIRACHAVVSLSSSCLPGTMGRQTNKGSLSSRCLREVLLFPNFEIKTQNPLWSP